MSARKCLQTGKIQYVRASTAEKAAAQVQERLGPAEVVRVPQTVYRCAACSRWHLTHHDAEHQRAYRERERQLWRRKEWA